LSHHERRSLVDGEHRAISLTRQAELLGISRSGLYYIPREDPDDKKLMDMIDVVYTDCPFYGSRRVRNELNDRFGIAICREHVQRLMRRMGIEAIYPKPKTSVVAPEHTKYPYLLRNITARHPNHIWGTDITYVRLAEGWAYLVALIDWYSRFVVSWELSLTLEIDFCLENLTSALLMAVPEIHNSDQGSHFTSPRYTGLLTAHDIQISMDGRGRCMDNIFTERLWRTVKYENVYLRSYRSFDEARTGFAAYFSFYNAKRRHQSLNDRTPADVYFERNKLKQKPLSVKSRPGS
jgi:putative transposase